MTSPVKMTEEKKSEAYEMQKKTTVGGLGVRREILKFVNCGDDKEAMMRAMMPEHMRKANEAETDGDKSLRILAEGD